MNKKAKAFSEKYNAKYIIKANEDTIIYWLENKGKWLRDIFLDRSQGEYHKFIKEMAKEIESYQRWMYLKGMKDSQK